MNHVHARQVKLHSHPAARALRRLRRTIPQYAAICRTTEEPVESRRACGQICVYDLRTDVITSLNKSYFPVNIRPSLALNKAICATAAIESHMLLLSVILLHIFR